MNYELRTMNTGGVVGFYSDGIIAIFFLFSQ